MGKKNMHKGICDNCGYETDPQESESDVDDEMVDHQNECAPYTIIECDSDGNYE